MADIRQTSELDDFERPDQFLTADPPGLWLHTAVTVWPSLEINSGVCELQAAESDGSNYWIAQDFDSPSGIEVWGIAEGGGTSGIAWDLEFLKNPGSSAVDGYRMRQGVAAGGEFVELYRLDNAVATSLGFIGGGFSGGDGVDDMLLFRYIPADDELQAWFTTDGVNWTNILSVIDSNHEPPFWLGTHLRDNSASQIHGWEGFGGGAIRRRTQIYRYVSN